MASLTLNWNRHLSSFIPSLVLCLTGIIPTHAQISGSVFAERVKDLTAIECDSIALIEIKNGNIPSKSVYEICDTLTDINGNPHEVRFKVLSDVVSIGTTTDFLRIPLLPATAQRVADFMNGSLPTRKLSDIIHRHATVKLSPHPMKPDASMTTVPIFMNHNKQITDTLAQLPEYSKELIAGHKKDIVITNRLEKEPGRVFIYGWHYPNGKPIQPLSGVHSAGYVDYSHGVRIILNPIIVDNKPHSIDEILCDPILFRLISNEEKPMSITRYNTLR